ncbi:hypothetical protein XPA_000556 [Xanthoria parietina]
MADQTNASEPTTDGVKPQDEGKKPEVTKPSITLMEGQPAVVVKVGADEKSATWTLPKSLLTHSAPFFEAALSRPRLESTTESLHMPDDDPDAFRFFLHWLFAWVICKSGDYPNIISRDATSYAYSRAWVLGDKLGCPRFQDFAFMHLLHASPFSMNLMGEVFDMTPVGSRLRQWMTLVLAGSIEKHIIKGPALQRQWADSIAQVEDLAADIVRLLLYNTKRNDADFLLVSSWKDFVVI